MFKKVLNYSLIPLIIASIIFYLCCLIQPSELPDVEIDFWFPIDKVVHFLMFFGLTAASALYYTHDKKGNISIPKMLIGSVLIPILYGAAIEVVQAVYFPPRQGDFADFMADALGSISALPFIFYYRNRLLKRNTK